MKPYVQMFLRFWWLVIPGLLAAVAVATISIYHVKLDFPPTSMPDLKKRAKPTYLASAQMIVSKVDNPYVRLVETPIVIPTQSTQPQTQSRNARGEPVQPAPIQVQPTSLDTLVQAANVLPLFITSDVVLGVRDKMFGPLNGAITAEALFSAKTPRGLKESPVPAIQVSGTAPRPRQAVKLTQATVNAFVAWLKAEQRKAKVPPRQRILITQLRAPTVKLLDDGNSYGIAILAFGGVLGAFGVLIVMLNRLFPRAGATRSFESGEGVIQLARGDRLVTEENGHPATASRKEIEELADQVQAALEQLQRPERKIERASDSTR